APTADPKTSRTSSKRPWNTSTPLFSMSVQKR
ncbi:uncharacterized protein METZ01_LOCUS253220, partial [marine metagenome]